MILTSISAKWLWCCRYWYHGLGYCLSAFLLLSCPPSAMSSRKGLFVAHLRKSGEFPCLCRDGNKKKKERLGWGGYFILFFSNMIFVRDGFACIALCINVDGKKVSASPLWVEKAFTLHKTEPTSWGRLGFLFPWPRGYTALWKPGYKHNVPWVVISTLVILKANRTVLGSCLLV